MLQGAGRVWEVAASASKTWDTIAFRVPDQVGCWGSLTLEAARAADLFTYPQTVESLIIRKG